MAPLGPRLKNIKAHVDINELTPGSAEWRRATGDAAADKFVKLAAGPGHQPNTAETEAAEGQRKLVAKFLVFVSKAFQLWPTVATKPGGRSLATPENV